MRRFRECFASIEIDTVFSIEERVLAQKIADLLHQLGEIDLAYKVYEKLINCQDNPKSLKVELLESGALKARSIGNYEQAAQWSSRFNKLKLSLADNNHHKVE